MSTLRRLRRLEATLTLQEAMGSPFTADIAQAAAEFDALILDRVARRQIDVIDSEQRPPRRDMQAMIAEMEKSAKQEFGRYATVAVRATGYRSARYRFANRLAAARR